MTQVSLPFNEVAGGPEDISHVMADFAAILAVVNGDIRNDNVAAAAAIAYSKLNLAASVVNGDVAAAAAIAVSKLAAGAGNYFLKTVGSTPTWAKGVSQQHNFSAVGTGAATVETDLQTVTIDPAALALGDVVRIRAGGTSTGSAGNHTGRLYFGATAIDATTIWTSPSDWDLDAVVIVTGASAQKALGDAQIAAAGSGTARYSAPAETISGAIVVKTTGQTANAADEITSEMLVVEIFPA